MHQQRTAERRNTWRELTGAQCSEVLDRLRNGLSVQFHLDPTSVLAPDRDVEEHGVGNLWALSGSNRKSGRNGSENRHL